MKENYEEHRKREDETILGFLFFRYPTGLFCWLMPIIIISMSVAFIFNILGNSTILNSSDIYYYGVNRWTGKTEVVKGCRPEHLTIDRKCDNEITMDLLKKSFPFLGAAKEKSYTGK